MSSGPARAARELLARLRSRTLFSPTSQIAPVAIPLVGRWATWLLGVGILAFGGGSDRTRVLQLPLALGTFIVLVVGSVVLCRLFGAGWPRRRGAVALVATIDLVLSLGVLWIEGGWSSAFYEVAMTTVMLPALVFGFAGALVAASAFSLGFLAILVSSSEAGGSLNSQVAALLNPFIVGGVVAVISDLLGRLERATARNLQLAASEERWRIAREIHDGVAQQSYMLALGLETASELARRQDLAGLGRSLPALEKLARQTLLEVRQYVAEGRPLILGERTLSEALAGLGREFSAVSRVEIEVATPSEGANLPAAQQTAIYRLAQESLANVFKHAEASHAWISLRLEDGQVELEVADDGRGIDRARASEGFGLEGMRRRVVELGGDLSVQPRAGGGTRVRARVPADGGRRTADGARTLDDGCRMKDGDGDAEIWGRGDG